MLVNELRAELVRRDTSVGELADRIGISRKTLWRKLRNPGSFKVSEIRAIQQALGLDASSMLSLFFPDGFLKETRRASR